MDNPTETFEVLEVLGRSAKGVHVLIKTGAGVKSVWVPLSVGSIYEYEKDGKLFREVALPEWLIERTGLKQRDS
jgi:hypothetical protein